MNQINDPALSYPAGTEFDYSVWEPGTQLSLMNVPWDSAYRDVVMFGNLSDTPVQRRAALNRYLDGLESPIATLKGGSPVRVDVPVRVPLSHNRAMRYNYLRARNPILPPGANPTGDIQKDYYYFILNARFINPGTTELTLQLDVFQTFIYDVQFGNSYVERGHLGIANERQRDNYGRDFLTIPEGIDTGSEYRIVATKKEYVKADDSASGLAERYNILLCSTVDVNASGGEVNNPSNPPKLETAPGGLFSNVPSGARYYVLPNAQALQVYMDYWKDKPWITQGIISITLIPPISRYIPSFRFSGGVDAGLDVAPSNMKVSREVVLWPNWRQAILAQLPERYRHLWKFLTSPYLVIEATSYTATPIVLQPEAWNNPNAALVERAALIPPAQKIVWYPRYYNTVGEIGSIAPSADDPGEYYDLMTQISGFPSVALVNNAHIGYLASNMNVMAQQYSAADWSQQRALRGAQVGYDQAQAGISANRQQTEAANQFAGASQNIAQDLARQNQIFNALGGGAMSGAAGLAAGPIGGAAGIAAGVGSGVLGSLTMNNTLAAQNQQLSAQTAQNWRSTDIANAQSQMVADSNRDLAVWGAKGDYEQAIASLDAKTRDTKMLQPTTSGQTGGEFLHIVHETMQIAVRWKMLDPAALATVGEYWLQFGYAVHRRFTLPASLMVMSKFTYWKLSATYLRTGPIPEGFKNAIRGIFEKGVTVWRNPNDIGFTDLRDNEPLPGVVIPTFDTPAPIPEPNPVPEESIDMAYSIISNSTTPGESVIASQITGDRIVVTSAAHLDILYKYKTGNGASLTEPEMAVVRDYLRQINSALLETGE